MSYPGYPEGLRVSVGTDVEIDRFLEALRDILSIEPTTGHSMSRELS